jgi:DNA-binding response OmpR family regulator
VSNLVCDLRDRIAELEEEIRQLREDTVEINGKLAAILSKQQFALLMMINKRYITTYSQLDHVSEDHGKYNRYEGEMHQTLRTKVAVWKLRQRLKPYGIEIKTLRGIGYYLDDENKLKLKQLMEMKDALVKRRA